MKLLGYRAAHADWHPRLVLLSIAADEAVRTATYEIPPGCREKFVWTYRQMFTLISPGCLLPPKPNRNRSYPTPQTGVLRFNLAPTPLCSSKQFGTAHTQLRMPDIADSLSRILAPHVPYWSPQLSRTAAGIAGAKSFALRDGRRGVKKPPDAGYSYQSRITR